MKRKIEEQSNLPQAMIEVFQLPDIMFNHKIVDNILTFRLICKFTNDIVAEKTKVGELLKQYKALNESHKTLEFYYNYPMVGVPVYILNFIIAKILFHGLESLSDFASLAIAGTLGAVTGNMAGYSFAGLMGFMEWLDLRSHGRNLDKIIFEEIKSKGNIFGSDVGTFFSLIALAVTSIITSLGVENMDMHTPLFYKELLLSGAPYFANTHMFFANKASIEDTLPNKRKGIMEEIKTERLRWSY